MGAAYWTLFNIAVWHVKLAFKDSAIVTRNLVRTPVLPFTAVPNAGNGSPVAQRVGQDILSGFNLFRPAFDHWYAAIPNAFRLSHASILPR